MPGSRACPQIDEPWCGTRQQPNQRIHAPAFTPNQHTTSTNTLTRPHPFRNADLLVSEPDAIWQYSHVTMPFAPMLATNSAPRTLTGRWVLEPKFDGWRVIVAIDDGVRVWTRRGHDVTQRLPELGGLADAIDTRVVLDGELVAGQGRASDFYGVLPRVARSAPLSFVAFDVLAYDGTPVINEPYSRRRELLDGLGLRDDTWCTAPPLFGSVLDVLSVCAEHDVEGIVAKRTDSRYRPGERSTDWLKLKTADWRAMHGPRRHEQ
jgi:ATP-dependent DNA ligase